MIIPSLDFFNEKIVRLYKGNYNNIKYYKLNIIDQLLEYKLQGANFVHLVDLNGAQYSKNKQSTFLKNILSIIKDLNIQIGGGIRNQEDIKFFLSCGVKRVIIGSLAITNKILVKKFFKVFGSDCIVLALDVKINNGKKELCINGWNFNTRILLEDIIKYYIPYGLKYILCTDISKDGTLLGPNLILYKKIIKKFPSLHLQSSGGVGSLKDIYNLNKIGVHDIIIGKAFLEKKIFFSEANLC